MTTIQTEIKQSRPFRSRSHEATVSLIRTSSDLMRYLESVVGVEDITMQQYNVLRILRGAGEPLCTMEIGERLLQRVPGITRLLDRLEKKRLIVRTRGDQDRRQVYCQLTVPGLRMVERLDVPVDRADTVAMDGLSDAEQQQFVIMLQKIRTTIAELRG